MKYLTPFKYFDPVVMLYDAKIELTFVWLSVGIIAIAMVGAYISYARRDLYI